MTEPTRFARDRFDEADDHYMGLALELADAGLYTARPNPRVGCVLVRDGAIVGRGCHLRAGEAHAEVNALRQAGDLATGATAYISLEPCSHHGRTPPCADALITAGVSRVVVAMADPNPRVAGGGLARLAQNGIAVAVGLREAQARALNAGFISRMERRRPWLRLKLAASLDGRTAMASGESKWITGAAARADVHDWRARSCAVMTGIGTALADDPALTVRDHAQADNLPSQPARVLLDTSLRLSPTARLLAQPGRAVVYTISDNGPRVATLRDAGAEVRVVASAGGRVDPLAVLEDLAAQEINEVLVECGPVLAGYLLQHGLVDELLLYQAMHLLGDDARPLAHLPGLEHMSERLSLRLLELRQVGDDVFFRLAPKGE